MRMNLGEEQMGVTDPLSECLGSGAITNQLNLFHYIAHNVLQCFEINQTMQQENTFAETLSMRK
jgi:hypothetical protein